MAALPDSVAALKDISDARIKSVDADVSAFAVAVNALAGELRASIIDLSSKLTADNAAAAQSLVNLQKAVQAQINKLDYAGVVKDFIGTYGDTEQYALDTLKALKVEPKRLAPIDQRALANLAAQDYQYLDGLGTAAIQAVTSGVVRNTLLGRPRSEIIQRISDTLDLKLRNYAVTYADTALASYDRASSSKVWTAAGLTMFVYRGPKDIKNRPFCDHHVGKTYSLDEINGKLNDELKTYSDKPLLPCLVYGGGWNCRHVWSPVPSKEPKTSKIFAAPLIDHAAIAKQEALDKAAKADAAALLKKAQDEADAAAADAAEQNAAHEKKVEIAELINSHVQDLKTKLQTLAKLQAQQAAAAQAAKEADDKAALQKKIELSQILKAHVADLQQQLADQAALDQEKAAAEEKAHHAALLANAENPNQMIETLDVAGEKIHTVQGKNYSSKGAAYNYASKVFQEAHPDLYAANLAAKAAKAVPAVPPSPAPPEPAKVPGAKIPDGMAASYVNGAGNVFTWNDQAGQYFGEGLKFGYSPKQIKKYIGEGALKPSGEPRPAPSPEAAPSFSKPPAGMAEQYVNSQGTMFTWDPVKAKFTTGVGGAYSYVTADIQSYINKGIFTPVVEAPAAPPSPAPAAAQFSFAGSAKELGGNKEKYFFTDPDGAKWLFKPEPVLMASADQAASDIARLVKPYSIEVRATELNVPGVGNRVGSIQKMKTDAQGTLGENPSLADLKKLTPRQVAEIEQEHVVDWLISNHDAHGDNTLLLNSGHVVGVDKTQAFKFIGKDVLSTTYKPNEHPPIYNKLGAAIQKGQIKFDPNSVLPAIQAAEAIDTDTLVKLTKPYIQSLPAGADQGKLLAQIIARKDGIRADFEKYYGELLGKPGFKFGAEPELAAAPVPAPPKKKPLRPPVAPAPAAVPAAPRGPSTAEQGQDVGTVARQALAAGVQGKVYKMDADTIEDQAALMWRETVGSQPRIVIRGKLRPEGETDLVKGFERFAADGGVDVLKPATIDIRALSKGQTRVTQADAPIDKLPGAWGSPPQYSADLGDGVSLKYFPFKQRAAVVEHKLSDEMMAAGGAPSWMQEAGSDMPYALRGTWEIHIDEAAAAANEGAIERALNKAAALGLDTRPATRADEEAMYLRKQAYILKLHDTPEWKAVEKSVARKVPAQQAAAMREFWAQRLNVKDLAALEQYEPSGSYERNFLRPGDDPVGYRLQYRFDLSDADVEREMKGYTLTHFLTNAKGGVPAFLEQIMESNGSMAATVEKNRIGVPIRGMSPSQDLGTGGGSYFFTRIRPETRVAGLVGLEFKKTLLRRMDAISYGSDKYGRVTGSTVETDRGSTPAEWQRFSRTGSNETIFKNAVSIPDWIQRVKVSGEVERQAAIEVFKSHGLSVFPDGRPVEDVVVNVQAYKPAPPPPAKPPSEPANTAKQSKADFDAAAGKKLPPTIKVDGTTYFYQAGSGKYEYKGSSKKGLAPIDPKYVEASAMKAAKEYYQIQ